MARAIGYGWRGGPQLLFLAPAVPIWLWHRCEVCGRWTNGYWLGRHYHAREYHQNDRRRPRFVPAVDPKRRWMQN